MFPRLGQVGRSRQGLVGDEPDSTNGRLRLVLSSKKVLVRVDLVEHSLLAWDGTVHVRRRWVRVYDHVLNEKQTSALSGARELAARKGLTLEVTDLSRQSALRRIFRLGP
jgi:hypothetical protein